MSCDLLTIAGLHRLTWALTTTRTCTESEQASDGPGWVPIAFDRPSRLRIGISHTRAGFWRGHAFRGPGARWVHPSSKVRRA